ncbi:MAG: sugar nucleotide-binding protein [Chloroflexi bacterium]|nr:sugar nucleotide-binding protein [Chloroflexota bacterium]
MKALITGMNGAVGQALRAHLTANGVEVFGWDRRSVPPEDAAGAAALLREVQPDVLFHLATASQPTGRDNEGWLVNVEWSERLAALCQEIDCRFLFTSSVMVFSDDAPGPFTPQSVPDARAGYGYEKLQAEHRVRQVNPEAIVARLGWQIGTSAGSNNMIDFFETQMAQQGQVNASRRWLPACSFLDDTGAALKRLAFGSKPGDVYLLNANLKWTFYQIAQALNRKHGGHWTIVANDDFVYDQRMLDERVTLPPLESRLDFSAGSTAV